MTTRTDAQQASLKSGKLYIGDIQVPHVEGKKDFNGDYGLFLGPRGEVATLNVRGEEAFQEAASFIAHAMAIAAGFTHFGEKSEVRNDYAPPSKSNR